MMTDAEVRAALQDMAAIKRAIRQSQMTEAWACLRALELKLGRALRVEVEQPAETTD
jgi:hypothetical protein